MIRRNEVDEALGDLLKARRVPADEGRLEAIREALGRRDLRPRPGPSRRGSSRYRLSLSFASALVVAVLVVWAWAPWRQAGDGRARLPSRFLEIVQDETRVDQALALLGGFAAEPGAEGGEVEWDPVSRSLLGQVQAESVLQALYESI